MHVFVVAVVDVVLGVVRVPRHDVHLGERLEQFEYRLYVLVAAGAHGNVYAEDHHLSFET